MELKRAGGLLRYCSNHLVLLTLLALMIIVAVLTVSAPAAIVSSMSAMIPKALPTPNCTPTPGSEDVLVKLDTIMKSPVSLEQDDPRLIKRIMSRHLQPPSTAPYSLTVGDDPSMGQSQAIREIMGDQREGFFIECGALDGETRSNTLVFEKTLGWRGLLVEGDPKNYELVLKKHRRAWTSNTCLSLKPYPTTVMFEQRFNLGKISPLSPDGRKKHQDGYAEVQCLPVYSLMVALNVTTVDYFSLDVEGVELEVLQAIPWDKVNIKTLSVEFVHGALGKDVLKQYMEERGYWVYKEVTMSNGWANDFIFVKKSYKLPKDVNTPQVKHTK